MVGPRAIGSGGSPIQGNGLSQPRAHGGKERPRDGVQFVWVGIASGAEQFLQLESALTP